MKCSHTTRFARLCAAFAAVAALVSCGSGGSGGSPPQPPSPDVPLDLATPGEAVVKLQANAGAILLLEERVAPIAQPIPVRRLVQLGSDGSEAGTYSPPAGWSLIDCALHPSGEASAVIATNRDVKLVRVDRHAQPIAETRVFDNLASTDPFYDTGGIHDDTSLLTYFTRDAVRVAAVGEEIALALRTGRNAVVAYRFGYSTASAYVALWRSLVEPGVSLFPIGLTGGTFDVFGALQNHWHVLLDADATGALAVAVFSNPGVAPVIPAHADHFHEPIAATTGILVTRIGPDGRRLGTTVVDTARPAEVHGLRLQADEIEVVGRVFSERRADGTGWNAYVARVDRASGALRGYDVLDVDRGDILFDIVPLAPGRFLVAGAAGYTQNPDGASIPEAMDGLLAIVESDGTVRQRIAFPAGARQTQVRSIAARGAGWLAGGMTNAPGTHSGDADPSVIRADGFARELALP
jgi:hypothetical protein